MELYFNALMLTKKDHPCSILINVHRIDKHLQALVPVLITFTSMTTLSKNSSVKVLLALQLMLIALTKLHYLLQSQLSTT